MSMTPFQLEGLRLLGYSRRESEFLFLVATHSGYFTNRQFKVFMQTDSGSVSHAFIRKLLDRKHATYHAYRSGGRVYHLFARKVYQAMERENLRTRKKHEIEYVKTRLVALDFVIEHSAHQYLETERAKVAFFTERCGVPSGVLPVKQYRARKSAEITPRFFVDRFPMFVDPDPSSLSVTLTYADSEPVSLDGFGTHLRNYFPLLTAISKFEFIYISPTSRLFQLAESEFHRILFGRHGQSKRPTILEYFRVRKAWDAKERVASVDVVLLKEAQAHYSGTKLDELYEQWRHGSVGDDAAIVHARQFTTHEKATFRTYICGSSLSVFGDASGTEEESCLEKQFTESTPQLSAKCSDQVPGS